MIQLRNIKKSFFDEHVLSDFSYDFHEHNFYLIFGPSGCGKTTLANIIVGIIPSDGGKIFYNGNEIDNTNEELFHQNIIYIAQDSYFIDYLNIEDNLKVSGADLERANELLKHFALEYVLKKYPDQLSGGEKQRVSIIQALSRNKNIIILDEPTASLDEKNKMKVFQFLKELKSKVTILCISHDEVAKKYCDKVIDFHKLDNYIENRSIESKTELIKCEERKLNLYSFVRKQKKYKKTEKKSIRILSVIIFIMMMMLFVCANPKEKIINSLGEDYHLNYLVVNVPNHQVDHLNNLKKENKDIKEIVYDYMFAGDYHEQKTEGVVESKENFDYAIGLTYGTLPVGDGFYYNDYLQEGSYFNEGNEVMLGFTYAQKLSDDTKSLIGREFPVKTAYGEVNFKIAGVFKFFGDEQQQYFKGDYTTDVNDNVYVNNKFTEKYLNDEQLSAAEKNTPYKHRFIVYFDDFKSMLKFSDKYSNNDMFDKEKLYVYPIDVFLGDIIESFVTASVYLLPILLLTSILVVAFYIQMQTIKLQHSLSVFGTYQYYGYAWKNITTAYQRYYLIEIIKSIFISTLVACICIFPFNYLIGILDIYPYQLFSFSPLYLCIMVPYLLIIAACCVYIKLHALKKFDWFDIIKSKRDLL